MGLWGSGSLHKTSESKGTFCHLPHERRKAGRAEKRERQAGRDVPPLIRIAILTVTTTKIIILIVVVIIIVIVIMIIVAVVNIAVARPTKEVALVLLIIIEFVTVECGSWQMGFCLLCR